jgi:hypothetical protein
MADLYTTGRNPESHAAHRHYNEQLKLTAALAIAPAPPKSRLDTDEASAQLLLGCPGLQIETWACSDWCALHLLTLGQPSHLSIIVNLRAMKGAASETVGHFSALLKVLLAPLTALLHTTVPSG